MTYPIRQATLDDIPSIRALERAASEPFRNIGMAAIADDEPMSPEVLASYIQGHRAWVIGARSVELQAYCLVLRVDGWAHIEQVSVNPLWRGRRLGRSLIEHLSAWGDAESLAGLTLTTFRRVPWNGPYYGSLGFEWLDEAALSPGLQAIREHEKSLGLDRWPRGCMLRRP